MGLHMFEEMNEITLNCIIKNKGIGGAFSITIDKNKQVTAIQDSIKEKCSNEFVIYDVFNIMLWKVNIDANENNNKEKIARLQSDPSFKDIENIFDGKRPFPFNKIRDEFHGITPGYIHLIVQGWCILCSMGYDSLEEHKDLATHQDRYQQYVYEDDPGAFNNSHSQNTGYKKKLEKKLANEEFDDMNRGKVQDIYDQQ